MIDQLRDKPGVVEWFRLGRHGHVEEALAQLRKLGVVRLRTHLSWADYYTDDGRDWYDWLLPKLAAETELLPCIHYTPPSISENGCANGPPKDLKALADFTDHVIDRYGRHFDALELWNEPNNLLDWDWRLDPDWTKFCTMLGQAAHWSQKRGKKTVLGGLCPNDLNLLGLMGERDLFRVVDVVAIHGFPGTWDSEEGSWPGWDKLLSDTRGVLDPFRDDLELWITETGYSTWRRDAAAQARRFLDAMNAPAERVYWYGLQDLPEDVASQEGYHFDERHYHLGLYDTSGYPKLTARLLEHGGQRAVADVLSLARPAPSIVGRKPVLITGGAGFIGSNLAASLAEDGRDVLVLDGLMRDGVEANLNWLRKSYPARISAVIGDVRDADAVNETARDSCGAFHFAAQVAVTSSLEAPRSDFETNVLGTLNLLEALRSTRTPIVFASTNKVYGDLVDIPLVLEKNGYRPADERLHRAGIAEDRSLSFHTPYGCSKGAADQYVLDYARSYGLPAAVLRMSCIYGQRQFGNEDQGWVAHFAISALRGEPITIFGDGNQVRDVMHINDAVRAYRRIFDNIDRCAGRAYNLGGGPENAVSLNMLVDRLAQATGRNLDVRFADWRQGDQKYYVSDIGKLDKLLGLGPITPWQQGTEALVDWLAANVVGRKPEAISNSSALSPEVR